MYKMHENQQIKRVNLFMSVDSMNSSTSKCIQKKTPFYQHDDPSKLNYYARFSPKRKKIDEQFECLILEGSSPLSPRSSKSSSINKRHNVQQANNNINQQKYHLENKKDGIINGSPSLEIKLNYLNRNEIYIDDEEQSSESNEQNEIISIQKSLFKNTAQQTQKNQENIKTKRQPQFGHSINQSVTQISQSQQNSSFQRIIEPSSSEDNQIALLPKASTGFQMRIEDDDSEDQSSHQNKQFLNHEQQNIVLLDSSQERIFKIAESIGSVKVQKSKISEKRQVKSQNVSFSLDSDLSMIEQKWNSYFETQTESDKVHQIQEKQNLFNENISQIGHKSQIQINQQINSRRMSNSSDDELPSFSNPNSSNYVNVQAIQSYLPEEVYRKGCQMNEDQKKQFKRQYTFGNQLNTVLSNNDEENQSHFQTQKSLPLFMKFLSKQTISIFTKQKSKNHNNLKNQIKQKKNQVCKAEIIQKKKLSPKSQQPHSININSKNNKQVKMKQKMEAKLQQKANVFEQENNELIQQSFISSEILIEEDPNQQDTEVVETIPSFETDIQNQLIQTQIACQQNQNNPDQSLNLKYCLSKNSYQSSIEKGNWKHNILMMLQKQRNQQKIIQKQIYPQNFTSNQIELYQTQHSQKHQSLYAQHASQQYNQIHNQNQFICSQQEQQLFKETQKTNKRQLIGYAKIHSAKGLYKGKAKTQFFIDKLKPTSSHSQYSENDNIDSQNCGLSIQKGSQRQTLTTATQQFTTNFYHQTYYSPKIRSNGIQEVENLKKYLKKLEQSAQIEQKQQSASAKIQIIESLEEPLTQRSQLSQYDSFVKFKSPYIKQGQKCSKPKQSYKFQPKKLEEPSISQKKIPDKLQSQDSQSKEHQSFSKSLQMLQIMIPTVPQQLIPIYQKIYTHVYEQELKYQAKIEKQSFLLSFMEQILKVQKEKIDCQGFLSSQNYESQSTKEMKFSTDQEEEQIFINKHIILGLIRKLAIT